MFERESRLCGFMTQYVHLATSDLDDEQMILQPGAGVNPPAWILGHVAVTADMVARFFDEPLVLADDWHARYVPGTAFDPAAAHPGRDELVEAAVAALERAQALAAEATEEQLARPHGVELLRTTTIHTVGDLIAHLLTTHLAFHLGQLSAWRRHAGYSPLF